MQRAWGMTRTALGSIIGLLLIMMVVLNVANAFGRYVFGQTIPGSDELLVFSMVWLVFLGAALATAGGRHLRFDLLAIVLPRRLEFLLDAIRCTFAAVLAGFVCLQSWEALSKLGRIGQKSMDMGVPMTVPHAAVFMGFALIALISAVLAVAALLAAAGITPRSEPGEGAN
ncbi:TRAP transporter small permease [Rhodospirillaceae bacterium SYSU D60014]|uniref:TRAP transporter small permease n=1 Tax=Virgifigura deserti TaxID=2268457 RepID=UPI000E675689